MADTNTYVNKTKAAEKWTTQEKFDALDKTTIPEGTEYNIVGLLGEEDLKSSVVTKLNNVDTKQDKLVSGTNIKTINGSSLLGPGNIIIKTDVVQESGSSTTAVMSQNAVTTELNKKITAPNNWTGKGFGMDSVLTRFDADGATGMLFVRTKLNSDGAGDGIIGYDGTGHCEVSTPVKELQAANKKYVDDAITNAVTSALSTPV